MPFSAFIRTEFDKMQIPLMCVVIPILHRISLATIGVCVFVRQLRLSHFLYHETPAIVVGFHIGYADKQKANKKQEQNAFN